jgi:acetyltransferase-like isoleucine patch superfamily enzyme
MKVMKKNNRNIHPTSIIYSNVRLGDNVSIGAFTIIYDNVSIGANSTIGPHCVLGEPTANFYYEKNYQSGRLDIGGNSLIRSGSIIYSDSQIGDHFETGHRVTIRENTSIGHHVRVGTNSDILGHCSIGEYTRLHSSVILGQYTKIGKFVWIFPSTVTTNDLHPPSECISGVIIDDFAVIGAHVTLLPGISVGRNSLIGAGSTVYRNVPEGVVIAGNPARKIRDIDLLKDPESGNPSYPWVYRFDRGMPWQGIGYKNWELKTQEDSAKDKSIT